MNTLYLIRHGQKEKTKGDPGLTELGTEQAIKVGEYLKDKNITIIYSSTHKRTQETARYLNHTLHLEIRLTDDLRERANWGDVENQDFNEFVKEWYEASEKRHLSVHNRPSSFQAGERLKKFILSLDKKYKNRNIVLVTHGGLIADFLRNEFGDKYFEDIFQKPAYKLDENIKECSITTISIDKTKIKLLDLFNNL